MAWLDGDLKIFAAGMAVGGKWNANAVGGGSGVAVVKCYNDSGVYVYFYMKFTRLLDDFSYGQFVNSITVIGGSQILPVTAVEKIDDLVLKVTCNISGQLHGVSVMNRPGSYLHWKAGTAVPEFCVTFNVAGYDKYCDIAYIFEQVAVAQLVPADTVIYTTYSNDISYITDTIQIDEVNVRESVLIEYI